MTLELILDKDQRIVLMSNSILKTIVLVLLTFLFIVYLKDLLNSVNYSRNMYSRDSKSDVYSRIDQ